MLVLTSTFPRWKEDTTPAFVYELSNRLAKKGRKIIVLAPHAYKAVTNEKLGNVEVYRFRYFIPSNLQKIAYGAGIIPNVKDSFLAKIQIPFFLISEYFAASNLIRKYKPNILHAHWLIPQGLLAIILKKIYKIPFIITVHGSDLFPLKNSIFRYLQKIVLSNCYACTVNSMATRNEVISRFPQFKNKIYIIPMGVNIEAFSKAKQNLINRKYKNKKIILFVGRLNEQKGIEYLIKAIPAVKKRFFNLKLLIIGEGSHKSNLEKLTESLGLNDVVEFLGAKPHREVINCYHSAHVFVLPSITSKIGTEGLGLVLLEAMAAKLPVVGTNTGGIKYIIKNNENGILVEEKNPQEIADAIILLLSNKKLREKIKSNAFKFVNDNYSWKIIVNKFNNLYEKVK